MNPREWPVTYWIIVVLLVAFIAQAAGALSFENFALWPNRVLQGEVIWGIFTSIFMHSGIFHFFFSNVTGNLTGNVNAAPPIFFRHHSS